MFDRFYRIEQHYYVDYQAVTYPKEQDQLCSNKQNQRSPKSQHVTEHKTRRAAQHIGDRIDDRVAKIIERDGFFAVSVYDVARVFCDFPRAFDHYGYQQPPGKRNLFKDQADQPKFEYAVLNVSE